MKKTQRQQEMLCRKNSSSSSQPSRSVLYVGNFYDRGLNTRTATLVVALGRKKGSLMCEGIDDWVLGRQMYSGSRAISW